MEKCVQCGSKIKENASFCPLCGCRNPLNKKIKTDDYTLVLASLGSEYPVYVPKSASQACLLACSCGCIGLQYKYLENKKMRIVAIIWSIIALLSGFCLGFFLFKNDIAIGLIAGLLSVIIVNAVDGLSFLLIKRKDGHGERLK